MNPIINSEVSYALSVFGFSCLLGVALSVFFSFLKILRIVIRFNTVVIAIQDFVFWFLSGMAVFMFAIWQNDGIVRGYVLIGALIGALVYYLTIGDILTNSTAAIAGFFRRISDKIQKDLHQKSEAAKRKRNAVKLRRKHEKAQARLKRETERVKRPKKLKKPRKKRIKLLNSNQTVLYNLQGYLCPWYPNPKRGESVEKRKYNKEKEK